MSFGHYFMENRHLPELCAVFLLLFLYSASEKVRLTVPDAVVSVSSKVLVLVNIDEVEQVFFSARDYTGLRYVDTR